ncbi:unnamed protein product [Arctia plantaginis]|uniref:Uncharacterized protein n=1 Tax=Arctia plantaginis TaxID=874455 RepID=A0A8S1B445_ARCPL|nr:unnamed protein product [Arctia plantaginis]
MHILRFCFTRIYCKLNIKMKLLLFIQFFVLLTVPSIAQSGRRIGKFEEVFAWRQITYDIEGVPVLEDRFAEENLAGDRRKRASDNLYFNDEPGNERNWGPVSGPIWNANPIEPVNSPAAINPSEERGRFFVQYNNLPMGAERVGNRLFITIPRRRYGIPATINYISLSQRSLSPALSPYPNMRASRSVVSVYRTRADECDRLWAVDTGAIEIPNNVLYLQRPSILVYDLNTDRQILKYELKNADLPANNTATGLASITVEIRNNDCFDAYAYIADVVTYGLIVYSLKQNTSWRHSHNYFSFLPTAGDLRVAGQSFQWNDGVFSLTLGRMQSDGCRPAYFHPMVSSQEFVVSTCELQRTEANHTAFRFLGDRGANTQSTMHGVHTPTNVMFFAEIGRDAVSCWNVDKPLRSDNIAVLARDEERMSYPSDLHITGDEVWVMVNRLPRFIYSRLDTSDYNFFVYRAKVQDLIEGTVCAPDYRKAQFIERPLQFSRYQRNGK